MNKQIAQLQQVIPPRDNPFAGKLIPALRQWQNDVTNQLNTQSQTFGATLASGATLTITNAFHKVSGAAQIITIVPPSGFTGNVHLIPLGVWTTATGGNIALGSTAVVGKTLIMTYDGGVWTPSY